MKKTLALILALVQVADIKGLQQFARFYVWIFRGTPLMLQLFVVLYAPGLLFDMPMSNRFLAAEIANHAALFTEEIGLTIIESNKQAKKPLFIELSLIYEADSVLIIERDSGRLFDLTDPDNKIKGLSGFTLSGLMEAHDEKAYLVTTGYNRNMFRFSRT